MDSVSQFTLAVLGADDPMGGAVLQLLEEREFPVGRLYPLTLREADASVVFRGQDWPCEAAQTFDFGQVQALLVASPGAAALRLVEQVRARRPTLPVVTLDDIDPAPALAVARILQSLAFSPAMIPFTAA